MSSSSVRIPSTALATLPAIPEEHRVRSFKAGVALVDPSDEAWGRDNTSYTPTEYGLYSSTSINVYAALKLRVNTMSQVPIKAWRVNAKGDQREVTSGPLVDLLARVNPFWTFKRLLRQTEWSLGSWGSCFWYLNRGASGKGTPTEMWWMRPDLVRVVPHPTEYLAGFIYEANGMRIPFNRDEVIWFRYENPMDEYSGLSPIAAARLSLDTAYDAMRSNRNIHRNGSRISGVIGPSKPDQPFTDSQQKQVAHTFETLYKGVDNSHKLAVVSAAIGFTPWMLTPKDAEFLGQLNWTLGDAGRAFGVAPELLGDSSHATYNNVESAYKALWNNTLIPELDMIADELTEQLLPLFPGTVNKIAFDLSNVRELQEDQTEIANQAAVMIDRGVPLNRVLQEFFPSLLPETGDGYAWGDVPIWDAKVSAQTAIQAASSPVDDDPPQPSGTVAGDDTEPDEPVRTITDALAIVRRLKQEASYTRAEWDYGNERHTLAMRRFERAVGRNERALMAGLRTLFARQEESVLARLRKRSVEGVYTRDDDDVMAAPFVLEEWVQKTIDALGPTLADILVDGAESALDDHAIAAMFDVTNPEVQRWLETRAQRFAEQINETTWEQLRTRIAEAIDTGASMDDIVKAVKEVMDIASTSRAATIAQTETVGALNAGSLLAAEQSGVVTGKTWLSAQDSNVRASHVSAHGQTVALDEDFTVGSGSGPAPGQIGVAKEDVNCRCTVTWVLAE